MWASLYTRQAGTSEGTSDKDRSFRNRAVLSPVVISIDHDIRNEEPDDHGPYPVSRACRREA